MTVQCLIVTLRLSDLMDCVSGADIPSELNDEPRLLSLIVATENVTPRTVALKVASRDERNSLLTAIRFV